MTGGCGGTELKWELKWSACGTYHDAFGASGRVACAQKAEATAGGANELVVQPTGTQRPESHANIDYLSSTPMVLSDMSCLAFET